MAHEFSVASSSAIASQLQNNQAIIPEKSQLHGLAKAKTAEKNIQQIKSQAARNILSLHSKLQAKRMKSAMVRKSDTKERRTKTSAAAPINADNKDQAKENWVKSDGDVTIL